MVFGLVGWFGYVGLLRLDLTVVLLIVCGLVCVIFTCLDVVRVVYLVDLCWRFAFAFRCDWLLVCFVGFAWLGVRLLLTCFVG